MNPSAVREANDAFYRRHPELVRNGRRIPLSQCGSNQGRLRTEWLRLYRQFGGRVVESDEARCRVQRRTQPLPGRGVLGVCVTAGGQPVPDAYVRVESGGRALNSAPTAANGCVTFEVQPGHYQAGVDMVGYEPATSEAVYISAREQNGIQLALRGPGPLVEALREALRPQPRRLFFLRVLANADQAMVFIRARLLFLEISDGIWSQFYELQTGEVGITSPMRSIVSTVAGQAGRAAETVEAALSGLSAAQDMGRWTWFRTPTDRTVAGFHEVPARIESFSDGRRSYTRLRLGLPQRSITFNNLPMPRSIIEVMPDVEDSRGVGTVRRSINHPLRASMSLRAQRSLVEQARRLQSNWTGS